MSKLTLNRPVSIGSLALIAMFLLIGVVAPEAAERTFNVIQSEILSRFGWFYILSVTFFLVFVLHLGLSRFGKIKLGPDDSVPDFPFLSWVAMLFAAGMGIGLMFFAVGEPLTHFALPPEAAPFSVAAQREAMTATFVHWGIHAWAIYAVVGLSLGYFSYRYNLPLTIRSGLYPIFKERIEGAIGNLVDIFAIVGTLFGIATSLGFGVLQINSGLHVLVGIPVSIFVQVALIASITAVATLSVVTGLGRGVRRLSELNLILAVSLMIFVLTLGPTSHLMNAFVQNLGIYLDQFLRKSLNIYAYEPRKWINSWTLFYWAWWISWSPFVGMFLARVSRGRTVREFVFAILFIPAGFTFLWMTVFGNSAILIDRTEAQGALSRAVLEDVSVGLFRFFEYLPFSTVTATLAVALIVVFFVTSSDSGALVVDTIAAGGETNTWKGQRIFWCALAGLIAAILLYTGGLAALQAATIAGALPFAIVMILLCWGLYRGMSADLASEKSTRNIPLATPGVGLTWQRRLSRLLSTPTPKEVDGYIYDTVVVALRELADEFMSQGYAARFVDDDEEPGVRLIVPADEVRDFIYGVQHSSRRLPSFTVDTLVQGELLHEARTFFSDGSQGYDVMGMSKAQIIADVLIQFERYQAQVQSPKTSLYVSAPEHR
ncbi:BCCT family transporter [Lujinxingia sediminis]|uniref:BCCT family transporter n=1 Tax=Lujinxingia sediminis TaxID=2480984 RepID=A0ABY0CR88_9DELT|nr:BCCT family transporter [Lujinxingia sediminis]RVU43085.1 BCCT family transporter [Lujinxingia sediminis]